VIVGVDIGTVPCTDVSILIYVVGKDRILPCPLYHCLSEDRRNESGVLCTDVARWHITGNTVVLPMHQLRLSTSRIVKTITNLIETLNLSTRHRSSIFRENPTHGLLENGIHFPVVQPGHPCCSRQGTSVTYLPRSTAIEGVTRGVFEVSCSIWIGWHHVCIWLRFDQFFAETLLSFTEVDVGEPRRSRRARGGRVGLRFWIMCFWICSNSALAYLQVCCPNWASCGVQQWF